MGKLGVFHANQSSMCLDDDDDELEFNDVLTF